MAVPSSHLLRQLFLHCLLITALAAIAVALFGNVFYFADYDAFIRATIGFAATTVILFLLTRYALRTRPHWLPLLRRSLSFRRAKTFAVTRPHLTRLAKLAAIILLLGIVSFARTIQLGTGDVFYFGHSDRWQAYLVLSFPGVAAELRAPSYMPLRRARPGWFFRHGTGFGGTDLIFGPPEGSVSHDYYVLGTYTSSASGAATKRTYWLYLPFLGPILTPLAFLPLFVWSRAYLRHLAPADNHLCPTCNYDLRAHKPGDRCPECGTPIPQNPS